MMTNAEVRALVWELVLKVPHGRTGSPLDMARIIEAMDWIYHARPPAAPRPVAHKE